MVALILTGAIVVCALVLQIAAPRLKREPDTIYETLTVVIGLIVLVWAPSWARSILVGGFAVVTMVGLGVGFVVVMLAIVIATAIWLPGGVSVLLFAILAIVGFTQIRAAHLHLIRIARAQTLMAGQQVDDEVELTGAAHAVTPTVDPIFGGQCAAWEVAGEGTRTSDTAIEIRGATGSALVDPTNVDIEWSRPAKVVKGDEAKRAGELLRLELSNETLWLRVIPEGAECYVTGKPTWEVGPNSAGLYRDSHMLPTFRSRPALLADKSEAQLRADHTWAQLSWGLWGTLCAAIAILQVTG